MHEPIDTGRMCVVCKDSHILAHVESRLRPDAGPIIIGSGSKAQYESYVRFQCANLCGLHYDHPPGDPDAAQRILREVGEKENFLAQLPLLPKLP